jgi:hypothetical protein
VISRMLFSAHAYLPFFLARFALTGC